MGRLHAPLPALTRHPREVRAAPAVTALLALAVAFAAPPASAHVGSNDVFYDGEAGPYRLYVTVRPPPMIPGVAEVEIRTASPGVREISLFPMQLVGPASKNPPVADVVRPSPADPQFFTASVWFMRSGSSQIRIRAEGTRGTGEMAVPVPAFARRTLAMQGLMGGVLFVLMLVLALGVVVIAGASARESRLAPGVVPDARQRRRGRIAMAAAAVVIVAVLSLGNWWWAVEARERTENAVYKAPPMAASLEDEGTLVLRIGESRWHTRRGMKGLVPDHGHLMHLFVVRKPEMDRFAHLHPEQGEAGVFRQALPPLPAGRYALFADIVHESGFPDTLVAEIDLPELKGTPPAGDDSQGSTEGLSSISAASSVAFALPDGGRMVWEREGPLVAKRLSLFRFRLEDAGGGPAEDVQLYMGMPGHAAFMKRDLSTFAHVHPGGSISMPALALAEAALQGNEAAPADPHAHHTNASTLPPEVTFPYGFPATGDYRIFVQMRRAGRVQTGVFDARVD